MSVIEFPFDEDGAVVESGIAVVQGLDADGKRTAWILPLAELGAIGQIGLLEAALLDARDEVRRMFE